MTQVDSVGFTEVTPPVFQQTSTPRTTYEPDDYDDPSDVAFFAMEYSDSGDTTNDLDAIDVNLAADAADARRAADARTPTPGSRPRRSR